MEIPEYEQGVPPSQGRLLMTEEQHAYNPGDYVWVTSKWPGDEYATDEKAVILNVRPEYEDAYVLIDGYTMRVPFHMMRPEGAVHPMSQMTRAEKTSGNGPARR